VSRVVRAWVRTLKNWGEGRGELAGGVEREKFKRECREEERNTYLEI